MTQTRDSIADIYGPRTPHAAGETWAARVDERVIDTPDHWVQSCCVLCSNGCAVDIGVKGGAIVGVRGRGVDRVNRGRLGPKGLNGWEANNAADRLKKPLIRRGGSLREATWDEAMGLIVGKTRATIAESTANAIGFYSTGQMFIEEYYTLGVIGKAGLGTPHMDGNTRLCTATAARALIESFGSDGQPGSYSDVDHADTILMAGHDSAKSSTVLWMRVLDRLEGPNPPKLVVIDPRTTETARRATVHIAPRAGTNVAVMNGLLRLVIQAGHVDRAYVEAHTVGFAALDEAVSKYTPEEIERIAQVPAAQLRDAAEILGGAKRLLSTVLQGFYQSNQAAAASIQVNNLNLIRGMIGKPGCGVLQMNGQPTAQNNRECGTDGEMPGFRNWGNQADVDDLARLWNVDRSVIPHWVTPTHAMQIFRYAEEGSIKLLWIVATNPAVSLPDLPRIRKILKREGLFVAVQDAFLTETAELADVVLPAALWGERAGTFTNADRTVHLSKKAVEPPGEARSDLDIFLDYARRMDFRDKDGAPLIKWSDPEGAFDAWRECSRGRPCDYSAMTYAKLSEGSGIQWPCTDEAPGGTERLYADGQFPSRAGRCCDFGHDLVTGAPVSPEEYKAKDPDGRAFLKPADYVPPYEGPDDDYPFWLTTGRVVYHFHTRTKTGRSKGLQDAAPDAFVQMAAEDARRLGVAEGDMVEVESRRGGIRAPARVGDILPGHLFIPFHYGYWDGDGRPRAANELTASLWDPVSKQPIFKTSAAKARKATMLDRAGDALGSVARDVASAVSAVAGAAEGLVPGEAHVGHYLGLTIESEGELAKALQRLGTQHSHEPDTTYLMHMMAAWSRGHAEALTKLGTRYPTHASGEPGRVAGALFHGKRSGGFGLLRDLHDLWLLAHQSHIGWVALAQAAQSLRDDELATACLAGKRSNHRQLAWLKARVEQSAPQALVVPS